MIMKSYNYTPKCGAAIRHGWLVLLLAFVCGSQTALAYDFSAVSPSGHTVYYNIIAPGNYYPNVSVTYPNTSELPWFGQQTPYGNLVLPDRVTYEGVTYNVAAIGAKAFYGCAGLTSVTIPAYVTSINYDSFVGCESMTSVTINSGAIAAGPYSSSCSLDNLLGSQVTNIVIGPVTSIGAFAFYHCSNLATVTLPSTIYSIGNCAFLQCGSLYRVYISNLAAWCNIDFASESSNPLHAAHHLYLNNSEITALNIPNSITTIKDYAFIGDSGLTSVTIPNSVTSIGENAFRGCSGLTSVFIPSGVTSISNGVFRECSGLTSVDLPNYISSIGNYAFYLCSSLNNLYIPTSVTSIGTYAFHGCSSLASVTIPSSVNTIGQHAFDACPQMTSVTINSNAIVSVSYSYNNNFRHIFGDYARSFTFGSGVTSIGAYAFWGCNHMTSVTLPGSLTSIGYSAFEHCLGLNRVQISDLNAWYAIDFANAYANPLYYANHFYVNTNEVVNLTVTSNISEIKDYAFVGYKGLHSVSIGYYVTSIGNSAFENCSGLTSVTIGNSVNTIGDDAFKDCTNLTSVTLNNSAIASADYTSSNNLKTIFGNQVTNYTFGVIVYSIGKYACYGCTGLTSLTFPNTLQTIGLHTFNGCTSLTSVTLPSSLYFIDQSAFQGCSGLNGVVISNLAAWCAIDFGNAYSNPLCYAKHLYLNNNEIINLTIPGSVSEIKNYAFMGSTGLHSVTFHSDVTSIGSQAFKNCTHLSALDIPSTITTIGEYAFENCSGMTTLTLPSNMSSISHGVFYNCTGLTEIHVGATVPPVIAGSTTFGNVPTAIPVYVPLGSAPSYQAAQYWSRFTNYVGAIVPGDLTVTVPYEQEFYQSFIPGKWTSYEGQLVWNGSINKYTANLSTNIDHWYFGFVNGVFLSSHAWANIGNTNHAFWLVSPIMHLDGEYNMLSFDMALTQASGFLTPVTPGAQNNTRIFALVSTDHGLTWTKLEAWKHGLGGYTEIESLTPHATTLEYNLASYADQDIMVGFYMECTNANDAANRVHIDNFKVEGYDLTIPPTITSVETDGHSATVRWEPANPWQQDWDVYYDVNGSSLPDPYNLPSFFTMEWLNNSGRYFFVSGNTHEQVINGLEAASYYRVWVRHRDPFFGTESSWTPATYFQTTSLCAPPKNPQVETTQTTATITWEPGQPNQNSWYIYVYGYDDMYGHDLTSPSFTMTGLTPGSEFQASISGSCTGGDGGSESIWVEFSTDDYDYLTVNEGDETNENVVIMGDYCCMSNPMSQTQFVIPADMLTDMQYSTIKKLSFYSESDSERWGDASFQIFMTEVNTSDFVNKCEANTVDFVNWNYMTQFYNGTLSIEHHVMTITPSFGGGFYYTNGNLVVGIRQNQTGDCHQGLEWYGVNTNTTQALYNTQLAGVHCEEFLPKVTFAYEPDPYKPPTDFFAYPTSSNEVYFGWMPREGVTSYDIEVSWSPDFDEEEDQLLTGLEGTDYTWIDYEYLFPNSTYYAHIRSHYVVDGTDHVSSWSESFEFETLEACPVPTDLTATEVGNLIVELDWTETGDATEWVIAFQADGEVGERYLNTYHHPYYLEAPYLEPGTTYTVRIHPLCPNGGFVFCEPITFTTSNNIDFADQNVKALCVANWDTNSDGELSYDEAEAVMALGEVFKNNDSITTFNELQFFTGLTSIADNAFGGCDNLTSVIIPFGVTSIGTSAFSYCRNLTTVIVPEGLTTIGSYAFMYDTHLTDFVFPESLRIIGAQTFDHCSSLTYLFIPASVISIPSHAFLGCSGLEYVSVAPGNTIYDSRDDCNAIIATSSNQLRIGCKSTIIPNTVTSIGPNAFRENKALTFIDLPESITTINGAAFYGCSSLMDITLPASLDSIGERGFCNCTGLQSITVEAANPPAIVTGDQDSFYGVDKAIPVYVYCDDMWRYLDINGTGTWGGFTNFIAIDCQQQSQVIALSDEGWNWWTPIGEMSLADVGDILGDLGLIINSQNEGFARFEDDQWDGTLTEFIPGKMYKIKANEDCTIAVTGTPVTTVTVTIEPGFNWIGYTGANGLTIAEALGSFMPTEGDEIHDEDGHMASFDGDDWVSNNLTTLQRGKGYLYYSVSGETKTIVFE